MYAFDIQLKDAENQGPDGVIKTLLTAEIAKVILNPTGRKLRYVTKFGEMIDFIGVLGVFRLSPVETMLLPLVVQLTNCIRQTKPIHLRIMAAVARERFLSEAVTLLRDLSPSVSQCAQIQNLELQRLGGTAVIGTPKNFCQACGSNDIKIVVVRTNSRTKKEPEGLTRGMNQIGASDVVIHKCQICSRSNKETVKTTHSVRIEQADVRSMKKPQSDADDGKALASSQQKTSSKKRAKERRDRDGLKALINKKTDTSQSSANEFNLMDFFTN